MRYSYFVFKYIRSFLFVRSFVRTMTLLVFALIYSAAVTYTSIFFIYNSAVLRFVESNNPIYVHLRGRSRLYAINVYLDPFCY